jgi:hypothetical protein
MQSLSNLAPPQPATHLKALGRSTSRLKSELVGAAISASLALAGAAEVLQLWRAHLNVPIWAGGDSTLGLMLVKNMQTTGWFQGTRELGAPFGQNLTGYPAAVGDFWNLVSLKALSTFLSPAATVNVFFILGFPVIAAVAYGCLRLLGVSRPFAAALGAVYALLPYHFLRAESHLFLSAYYALPVSCVLAVWLYHDRLALWAKSQGMPRTSWAALASALLLAGTGLYYAVFTMVLLAAAGVLGSLAARKWRPFLSGCVLIALMAAALFLQALPNILHSGPPGSQTAVEGRSYGNTEFYGLKITNLLLPLGSHRIPAFARLHEATAHSPIPGEGMETLGILGVVGLIAVALAVLMPVFHGQSRLVRRLQPLGALAVVSLLAGTVAGLNSVIAALGFAELRAWNRISVLIGFLALAGLGHLLDAARARWSGGTLAARRLFAAGAAGLVLIVGVYDQTSPAMIPDYAGATSGWDSDQAYFAQVQSQLGAGASVFTLPYAPFPENPPIVNMGDYSHLRGYLHSNLRWSYGGVKNEESEWQPVALQDGIAAALPKLVVAGFGGVYINRRGYADAGAKVESEITAVIGPQPPLVNADKTLAVYDLRAYAKSLHNSAAPRPSRNSVLYPARVSYGIGVYGEESSGTHQWRWAQGSAEMTLANPSPIQIKVVFRGSVHVADATATIQVRVGDTETLLRPVNGLAEFAIPTTVEPGTIPVQITSDTAATPSTTSDTRDLRQQLLDFAVVLQ